MITVSTITANDDLEQLTQEINSARWDDANEMASYSPSQLEAYLECENTIFLACHDIVDGERILFGIASGRLQPKPYDSEWWLYIDEVDVCADLRCRGAGKALMQTFFHIARDNGCDVTWLGTEVDNRAANALYRSLDPSDIEQVVGYTYEMETE